MSVSSSRGWLLPTATGVAGFAVGVLVTVLLAAPPVAPAPVAAQAPLTAAPGATPGAAPATPGALGIEDVRRVVREELEAHAATAARRPASGPAPQPPTAEQQAAWSQAESVVAGAIARRSWTDADAQALRGPFDGLSPDQQAELLRQLSVAVNQGRLDPRTDRMPF